MWHQDCIYLSWIIVLSSKIKSAVDRRCFTIHVNDVHEQELELGHTTKWGPTLLPIKRTALCTFCKFMEALNVGLVEWKWYFCVTWYHSCKIMIFDIWILTSKMFFRALKTIWIWFTNEMITIMNVLITIKLRMPQLSTIFAMCIGCPGPTVLSELTIIPAVFYLKKYICTPEKYFVTK